MGGIIHRGGHRAINQPGKGHEMTITKLQPKTKLERAAATWLRRMASDYESGIEGVAKDLFYGGCQSGMVGELIYYHDTVKFYKKHKKEIHALLRDNMESLGVDGPSGLFGDKWDKEDPLADDASNQNLLAWFGFEEAARRLCDEAGIEV